MGGSLTRTSSNAFKTASNVSLIFYTLFSRSNSSKGTKESEQSSFDLGLEIAIFLATYESLGSISKAARIVHAYGDLLKFSISFIVISVLQMKTPSVPSLAISRPVLDFPKISIFVWGFINNFSPITSTVVCKEAADCLRLSIFSARFADSSTWAVWFWSCTN